MPPRWITITDGTNRPVGRDAEAFRALDGAVAAAVGTPPRMPTGWDGRSAERLAEHLGGWLRSRQ